MIMHHEHEKHEKHYDKPCENNGEKPFRKHRTCKKACEDTVEKACEKHHFLRCCSVSTVSCTVGT